MVIYIKDSEALYRFHGCKVNVLWSMQSSSKSSILGHRHIPGSSGANLLLSLLLLISLSSCFKISIRTKVQKPQRQASAWMDK